MPARPRLAGKEAAAVRFPTWDELVEEATVDLPPYEFPVPELRDEKGEILDEEFTVYIPVLDGEQYIQLVRAQRVGDAVAIFEALFPDLLIRGRIRRRLKAVHYPFFDALATKVMRYFYGLSIKVEAKKDDDEGN